MSPGRRSPPLLALAAMLLLAAPVYAQPAGIDLAAARACRRDPVCAARESPLYAAFYAEALRGRVRRMGGFGGLVLGAGVLLVSLDRGLSGEWRPATLAVGLASVVTGALVLGLTARPAKKARTIELLLEAHLGAVVFGLAGRFGD